MQDDKLVIVVEDEPNAVFLFELALAQSGISNPIRVLPSPGEALSYLNGQTPFANRELFPIPALLFLNLDYPENAAGQLVSSVRRTPGLESLLILGISEVTDYQRKQYFFNLGLNAFFQKQRDIRQTVALIREIDLLHEVLDTFRHTEKENLDS
jgi:DNA-binding response OmpR family regulator